MSPAEIKLADIQGRITMTIDEYMKRLERAKKKSINTKRRIKRDQKRADFVRENSDLYHLAEQRWLYGEEQ